MLCELTNERHLVAVRRSQGGIALSCDGGRSGLATVNTFPIESPQA
jgi:hypothetical protein